MYRPLPRLLALLALVFSLPGCDAVFGGDFGHDSDAAMARLHKLPSLFPPGELKVQSVWEPGDGITHIRFMYEAASAACPEPMMEKICAETGDIRRTTGAKVEAWCHGSPGGTAMEGCVDARRLPAFTR